jgi:23S rRNA (pseudouridine1915-N3)-methyltransferase
MRIILLQVGKTEEKYLLEKIKEYAQRVSHYNSFELMEIPAIKQTKSFDQEFIKKKEGELILKKVTASDSLVLLDEKGKQYSSIEFAGFLRSKMNSGTKNLVFVIGGAFGFSDEVYQRANYTLSLSKMTFSHQMVRLFFVEQLYRAYNIISGGKYHH